VLSRCYHSGALLSGGNKNFIKIHVVAALIIVAFSFLFGVFRNGFIIQLFGMNDPELIAYAKKGIAYLFSGYLFLGMNMVFIEYYQSIRNIRIATLIVFSRNLILFIPLLDRKSVV